MNKVTFTPVFKNSEQERMFFEASQKVQEEMIREGKHMKLEPENKNRKIGKVEYVSIFSTPEQEKLFSKSAMETMSKEVKLKW